MLTKVPSAFWLLTAYYFLEKISRSKRNMANIKTLSPFWLITNTQVWKLLAASSHRIPAVLSPRAALCGIWIVWRARRGVVVPKPPYLPPTVVLGLPRMLSRHILTARKAAQETFYKKPLSVADLISSKCDVMGKHGNTQSVAVGSTSFRVDLENSWINRSKKIFHLISEGSINCCMNRVAVVKRNREPRPLSSNGDCLLSHHWLFS